MFVHLHCHSPYSFLNGVSSIEALVAQAALYQMPALALTDHNTIAGLPELHKWAAVYGIKPISGAELTIADGTHLTVLAETRQGYRNLCELLTLAHAGEGRRRTPYIEEETLFRLGDGLLVLSGGRNSRIQQLLHRRDYGAAAAWATRYKARFGDAFYLEMQWDGYPKNQLMMRLLYDMSINLKIPIVSTSDVHYTDKQLFPVHDVMRCIALNCDVYTPHPGRPLNREAWLHDVTEAKKRFGSYPEAMARTMEIAQRCQVALTLTETHFPKFALPTGAGDSIAFLRHIVYEGAHARYPRVDADVRNRLEHELDIIVQLGYVDYFLVVWDIVRYARSKSIRCAGRGSAADSAVAYCLYITDVDAAARGLLFERFMSLERAERPDIDIDFASDRRDEVMAYVYEKYGRDKVARVATYQTFRGRSAVREIGAALALPTPLLDTLAKRVPWSAHADELDALMDRVPELMDYAQHRQKFRWLFQIAHHVAGFPRHFGMHVGGIVVSRDVLYQTTSLQPSAKGALMTPFDKRTVEDVGLVKLDLLSLRTMSAIENAVRLSRGAIDYDNIPLDDEATFAMIRRGETMGVFQLESPAQRALQSRLHATGLEDIVASVALIRPGPIQGNMVDPFIARRHGNEPITYLHPKLEPILGKTYGVVLFQEQVIEIATAIAAFTPGEADELRRVMSHARNHTEMEQIGRKFMAKAAQNGVTPEVANTIFSYIQSYASYGFCEAHAAAFATTAYKTAYLVKHYPAQFYASVLNQYPMGYYPVHVVCAEARRRGVSILPVDINESEWSCTTPDDQSIRLGFRLIKRASAQVVAALVEERMKVGRFMGVADFLMRVPAADRLQVEHLIRVGAFDVLEGADRRSLLWRVPGWLAMRETRDLPLLAQAPVEAKGESPGNAAEHSLASRLVDEYNLLGVGVSGHWLEFIRRDLTQQGYVTTAQVLAAPEGARVVVAGLAVRPHRPPTKSGRTVVFFTLEDETNLLDATMFESVYHSEGAVLFTPYGRLLGLEGVVQRRGGARAQLLVEHIWPLTRS
ncbi:DNA polymerase III subunit alpha [Alicyclobacillus acidoterrestris]|uniref:DNA-directed DNA polymerase n=2 Tax=Alicyclobacillus acidoterrestris TaxID=1450 RepID=A0A9E6ZTV7_ALIAG|nr:DNA polymerase III subunit alpha [Alicyclobacillus acidoterrestris]UNO50390.1 DNA polymerase III subunit alpha [Alicyclobacillus acidoterrestris]